LIIWITRKLLRTMMKEMTSVDTQTSNLKPTMPLLVHFWCALSTVCRKFNLGIAFMSR